MRISDWSSDVCSSDLQLRQAKRERRTLVRRVAVIGAGITLVGLTIAFPPAPRLVWNASASAPIGPYAVTPGATVEPGDMVIARVPDRRSEEHTSEPPSLMRHSYAVFCLKKKNKNTT